MALQMMKRLLAPGTSCDRVLLFDGEQVLIGVEARANLGFLLKVDFPQLFPHGNWIIINAIDVDALWVRGDL